MNDFPTRTETKSSAASNVAAFIILGIFALAFAGLGTAAMVKSAQLLGTGDTHNGVPVGIIGFFFSLVGFGIIIAFVRYRRNAKVDAATANRYPGQPWMLRPDWAAGRIESSTSSQTVMLFIMAAAFLGIGGTSAAALPRELSKHNYPALVVLFFPAVGLGLFVAFLWSWMQQLRTGKCVLEMARVPAPLGGKFEATIQTASRLKLQHALHLQFSCIRRVANRGRNSSPSEYVLWEEEKVYRPDATYPEMRPGRSNIPIYFKLPANQPESSQSGNVSIIWRLEAKSVMSGANFYAMFEVPVFNAAGTETVPADEPDPTAAMQMPVEAMRRDEQSIIRVSSGPDGEEFYFPARRNWKKACGAAFAMIFCDAMLAVMTGILPIVFEVFMVLFVAIVTVSFFDLWLGRICITVNSGGLRRVKRWGFFSRASNYLTADVAGVKAEVNCNIVLTTQAGSLVSLADGASDLLEAQWIANQMNAALNRAPQGSVTPVASPMPPAIMRMTKRIGHTPAIGWVVFLVFGLGMIAPVVWALMSAGHLRVSRGAVAPTKIAPRTASIQPAGLSTETAAFSLSGSGFKIETLDVGRPAFQNRKFVWEQVPEKFRGCRYTQLRGGARPAPQIKVRAKQDAALYILTSSHHRGVDLNGWSQTDGEF